MKTINKLIILCANVAIISSFSLILGCTSNSAPVIQQERNWHDFSGVTANIRLTGAYSYYIFLGYCKDTSDIRTVEFSAQCSKANDPLKSTYANNLVEINDFYDSHYSVGSGLKPDMGGGGSQDSVQVIIDTATKTVKNFYITSLQSESYSGYSGSYNKYTRTKLSLQNVPYVENENRITIEISGKDIAKYLIDVMNHTEGTGGSQPKKMVLDSLVPFESDNFIRINMYHY